VVIGQDQRHRWKIRIFQLILITAKLTKVMASEVNMTIPVVAYLASGIVRSEAALRI
jgi:hypothetical protein